MGTTWDQLTVEVTNNLSDAIGDGSQTQLPTHGSITTGPAITLPVTPTGGTATTAFVASSDEKGSSELGVGPGTVTYTLNDGTVLNIAYHMPFPVGQTTTVTASLVGNRSGNYGLTGSFPGHSYRGQGRRDTAKITVAAASAGGKQTITLKNEN